MSRSAYGGRSSGNDLTAIGASHNLVLNSAGQAIKSVLYVGYGFSVLLRRSNGYFLSAELLAAAFLTLNDLIVGSADLTVGDI